MSNDILLGEPEDDFEIDIVVGGSEILDKPIHQTPYAKPIEIIIDAQAWWLMNQHAREDLRYEAGGVMLGHIYHYDEGGAAVRVTMAVPAREAVNSPASIQFTYETWRQMEKERQDQAPQERLIGWYHTHPGFSAFFSSTDHFMHENFFAQPWHIALVIDPIKGEHRFYRWDNNELRESLDFLLQVTHLPAPQPPLNTTLITALQRSLLDLRRDTQEADTAELQLMLLRLQQRIPRAPSNASWRDLLPLIVAMASGMDQTALDQANALLQEAEPVDSPIQLSDLRICSSNTNPKGAIAISHGWLAQKVSQHYLHFHGLSPISDVPPLCERVEAPFPVRDLTVDIAGNVLLLRHDKDTIYNALPPLLLRQEYGDGYLAPQQSHERLSMNEIMIDWGDWSPPQRIGKILLGGHYLHLLTKERIYTLHTSEQIPHTFVCQYVHKASELGWSAFWLTDWDVDDNGGLYLLPKDSREVWVHNPLGRAKGIWQKLLSDGDLNMPRSIAVGLTTISIFDSDPPVIKRYGLFDGQLKWKWILKKEGRKLGLRHIFSDGYKGLYLVTDMHILSLPN